MTPARSSLRAGAVVFALLSVALHAAVWTAGRDAGSDPQPGFESAPSVRLVALAAPQEPAAVRAPATAQEAAATPDVAAARPVERVNRPLHRTSDAHPAKRASPNRRSRSTPPAKPKPAAAPAPHAGAPSNLWSRPLVLPEFDDSLDAPIVSASPDGGAKESVADTTAPTSVADEPAAAAPKLVRVPTLSGSARYRVHYGDPAEGNVVATVEQQYEIGSDRYRLHSEGRATGLVSWIYRGALVQQSSGRVSSTGLQPERYREQRGERPAREAVLDPDGDRVRLASGREAALPPGAQDRLSVLVQLGLLLRSEPARFVPGAVVERPVLANSQVTPASWRVLGPETVTSGDAAVAALHLRREPLDDDEPAIDLWLSLEPRVLPLRMRVTESSGRALDQVVVVDDR